MDNIIVYVDDAAYALQVLQPLCTGAEAPRAARWIVVGCAPRVTHRVSKWVTHSARESWRGKWAEKVFSSLMPLLQQGDNAVVTQIAQTNLQTQTETLIREFGVAKVIDARRPKFGHDLQPLTAAQAQDKAKAPGFANPLGSAGLLGATD